MVVRQPLGVVSVISPWNFPLLLSTRGLAFALALGNTVVLKPSEETPVSGGLLIAELFADAKLPPGIFNVVTCSRENVAEVGDELVTNAQVGGISFTGSTAVGRQVASKAGHMLKKACVELGGKDSLIILADADMELALNAATFGTFMHQGQICMSVEKIIVDESIAAEFTERFVEKVKTLGVGDPREMTNVIGPIINQHQLKKIHGQVTDAIEQGAELLAGGNHEGLFYQPTVLTNIKPEMRIYHEETFGPVAPIIRVKGVDEAVAVANDSEYGLSAGIITRDEEKGLALAHRLQTVNDEPHVPFGGMKNSGLGRHGGKASIETFTELRWLTLERGGRQYPPPFLVTPTTDS
jgi:aldehyde dehydrogenase (NAD+)